MKVLKKQIKNCEDTGDNKMKVLDLHYSHRGEKGRILIRDYKDTDYKEILKRLRLEVRKLYDNQQVLRQHNKERA